MKIHFFFSKINFNNVLTSNVDIETKKNYNEVLNIAYGNNITLNELFNVLKESLIPFDINIKSITPKFGSERIGDIEHSIADISKARRIINYNPTVSAIEGIRKTCRWYYDNNKRQL